MMEMTQASPLRDERSATSAIRERLYVMFNAVDEQLAESLNAVLSSDEKVAERVGRRDDFIDDLEMEIDGMCEAVIATRPTDRETIRFVMTAIKINTDLERMGDHCRNLARAGAEQPRLISHLPGDHFDRMVDAVRGMLYSAQDAFTRGDRKRAWELISNESAVNRLHRRTLDLLMERQERTDRAFTLGARIFALSKSLERIADHCVNIAESVLFWLEGIDVRHGGRHRNDIVTNQ
jgi:phosphate transport system protein